MRAFLFGSYSMPATLAGIPSLILLKSIILYFCLCPPPLWREVILPLLFLPPEDFFDCNNDFSGFFLVISLKSVATWPLMPGVTGLIFFEPILNPKCLNSLTLRKSHNCNLFITLLAIDVTKSFLFAFSVHCVDS